MKNLALSLLAILLTLAVHAQDDLTTNQWQSDLRFLQKTVHEEYDFLFKKVTAETFDAEVDELYTAIPNLEEHEIIVGLARIVALFGYGHTSIGLSGWWEREAYDFHQMPYNLYQFNDGIYVQGVHKDYAAALGARVLEVEGMPVEKALVAVRPVVSAENDQFFKAYGLSYLGTPEVLHAQGVIQELKDKITLTLEKEGKTFEQTFAPVDSKGFPGRYMLIQQEGDWLDARDQNETPYYLKNLDRVYYYEYLPEHKTVYIRQSQIQDDQEEDIPTFYQRVFDFVENNDVERLVLDVRLNGGGNNYKNKPIVTGLIRCEQINQQGKLFVILGRNTFSACQNLVNELHTYTEAIFVGEPTAENINFYGDTRVVELPNSRISVRLSFAWWQDKPQWENGPWLPPHLAVDMSFEDYRSNRDPVLEAALTFKDDNFILDPMQHLTELFMAGKLDEVKTAAAQLVKDKRYRYFDFEAQFNRAGYNLMQDKQMEPALFVFQLNNELFPESANTWDSLGEVLWKTGQTEKAIECYEKAIRLDPNGAVGENAKMMLKKIQIGASDTEGH